MKNILLVLVMNLLMMNQKVCIYYFFCKCVYIMHNIDLINLTTAASIKKMNKCLYDGSPLSADMSWCTIMYFAVKIQHWRNYLSLLNCTAHHLMYALPVSINSRPTSIFYFKITHTLNFVVTAWLKCSMKPVLIEIAPKLKQNYIIYCSCQFNID